MLHMMKIQKKGVNLRGNVTAATVVVNEFKILQSNAGLSNRQSAKLFGVGTRQIERWRAEKPLAPKAVIMCLISITTGNPVKVNHESDNINTGNNNTGTS